MKLPMTVLKVTIKSALIFLALMFVSVRKDFVKIQMTSVKVISV